MSLRALLWTQLISELQIIDRVCDRASAKLSFSPPQCAPTTTSRKQMLALLSEMLTESMLLSRLQLV